jgi:hypothetical protein
METIVLTALAALAFGSLVFYRRERDRHLNYRTGLVFRAWIVQHLTPILADEDAPRLARRLADAILASVYDRRRLVSIAYAAAPSMPVRLPVEQLGAYADIIKLGAQYMAALAVLERRGTGSALRKFLDAAENDPLQTVADLPSVEDEADRQTWSAEAVIGLSHFPASRLMETKVEESLLACT